jgi:hypothetical protein
MRYQLSVHEKSRQQQSMAAPMSSMFAKLVGVGLWLGAFFFLPISWAAVAGAAVTVLFATATVGGFILCVQSPSLTKQTVRTVLMVLTWVLELLEVLNFIIRCRRLAPTTTIGSDFASLQPKMHGMDTDSDSNDSSEFPEEPGARETSGDAPELLRHRAAAAAAAAAAPTTPTS